MAESIVMPRLSDSMEEGTILSWLKAVGDQVAVGDELVEIETDKANMVFEADVEGTLVEINAQEGDTVPLGEVIARVGEPGEAPSGDRAAAETGTDGDGDGRAEGGRDEDQARAAAPTETAAAATRPTQRAAEPATPAEGDGRVKASPLARRIASERGVDLAALSGSGPGGRIIKADVERAQTEAGMQAPVAAATAPASTPGPTATPPAPETAKGEVDTVAPTRTQQTIARRMAESKATVPHFYLQAEIDMSAAVAARSRLKSAASEGEVVPSLNDMVIKAAALALRDFPRANGAYRDGRFELYERINIGVAVAAQDALVVPTIFDADRKGLAQIATEARELARRVREQQITPPELSGGTFSVSNLGMFGITNFHPVINPPQAAILAVGEITERPVLRDGELAGAHLMGATLACDHRILYGADGAQFLARVRALLEEPVGLAL
jgi:pyruvate dehydrogenase E2 component (dihydrolipoamide acetyltransferase)